jgi:hypothetical protein
VAFSAHMHRTAVSPHDVRHAAFQPSVSNFARWLAMFRNRSAPIVQVDARCHGRSESAGRVYSRTADAPGSWTTPTTCSLAATRPANTAQAQACRLHCEAAHHYPKQIETTPKPCCHCSPKSAQTSPNISDDRRRPKLFPTILDNPNNPKQS